MDLERVKAESARLSPWAHLATVGRDGDPDVVPIHPAWEGDTLWFMTGAKSVKARNIAHHGNVALHWQVSEAGDGLEVWGAATVHAVLARRRRLWQGVFVDELEMAPEIYWQMFSDAQIRRIHQRVLEHIKQEVESSAAASGGAASE